MKGESSLWRTMNKIQPRLFSLLAIGSKRASNTSNPVSSPLMGENTLVYEGRSWLDPEQVIVTCQAFFYPQGSSSVITINVSLYYAVCGTVTLAGCSAQDCSVLVLPVWPGSLFIRWSHWRIESSIVQGFPIHFRRRLVIFYFFTLSVNPIK